MTIKEAVEKFNLPESRIRTALLVRPAWAIQETTGRKCWVIDESKLSDAVKAETKYVQDKLTVKVEKHGGLLVKVIGVENFIAQSSVDEYLALAKSQEEKAADKLEEARG